MSQSRSRTPLVIGIVLAVVAVVAIAAVVLTGGGDDDDATDAMAYGVVQVDGDPLPPGETPEAGVGLPVPRLTGTDYDGNPVTIAPGEDGPMLIVVMAHWCPHCNREIPLLVDWEESGQVPEGLQVVGISTAATEGRDHFPPGTWLDELGWDWPVIADDEAQTAAAAVGTTGYPYMLFVAADGTVQAHASGELPIEAIQQLADAAAATADAT
jgi:thiol-disulfide isomerase/thioredoxin